MIGTSMLVDDDRASLGKARLSDIPVYYGELLSEEAEFTLEFSQYDTLIAATPNPAYNALLCEKFGYEYGMERVFRIAPDDGDMAKRRQMSSSVYGRPLATTGHGTRSLFPSALLKVYTSLNS
jgi:hypothetical protein